jgi:hypothetical protein
MAAGSLTAKLTAAGWRRNDEPWEEQFGPGECTDEFGCILPGRWTHEFVQGEYCARHAAVASRNRRWF